MFSTPGPRLFVDFLHIQEQFCENKKHSTHPGLNNRTWTRRLKRFSVHITFKSWSKKTGVCRLNPEEQMAVKRDILGKGGRSTLEKKNAAMA